MCNSVNVNPVYICFDIHLQSQYTPGDALKFSANSFRMSLEEYTTISIKMKLIITSERLRKYTPKQRQCFFDSKSRLRLFNSQSNFDRVKSNKLVDEVTGIQRSRVVVYYQDQHSETVERKELTVTSLLSTCGGLLDLFMGTSVLSIIEILYYSYLRWYGILRRPSSEGN